MDVEGDWGNETASLLRSRSPTSLKVTFRQMREGAELDFASCQRMEFRIMARMMEGRDFYEGVRAALIDKDQSPRWVPPSTSTPPWSPEKRTSGGVGRRQRSPPWRSRR